MTQGPGITYRDAGVDIDAGDELVERIKPLVRRAQRREVLAGIGGFGALVEIPQGYRRPVLVAGTDESAPSSAQRSTTSSCSCTTSRSSTSRAGASSASRRSCGGVTRSAASWPLPASSRLAEESRLIVPIGRWVLDEACRQAAVWHADGLKLGISVNVSAGQLGRREFAEDVQDALARWQIEPSSLTLEITETTLVRDVPAACERLQEVKALGVRIAIDDFGTGYASLSHLQRMPVDILKIDRSFVSALGDGPQSRELLAAILGVGQSLSLSVVAEGIELASQQTTLEEMGCEMAQGFLLGHPGPAEEIEALLERNAPGRALSSSAS